MACRRQPVASRRDAQGADYRRRPAVDASAVDTAERVLQSTGLHADDHVVEAGGDVAETLCRIADERDVDVIVVGSGQKAFLERLISPSVSTDLAKAAPRPVLIVH